MLGRFRVNPLISRFLDLELDHTNHCVSLFIYVASDIMWASVSCLWGRERVKKLWLPDNPQPLKALQKDLTCVR